jgi:hypothetical protein
MVTSVACTRTTGTPPDSVLIAPPGPAAGWRSSPQDQAGAGGLISIPYFCAMAMRRSMSGGSVGAGGTSRRSAARRPRRRTRRCRPACRSPARGRGGRLEVLQNSLGDVEERSRAGLDRLVADVVAQRPFRDVDRLGFRDGCEGAAPSRRAWSSPSPSARRRSPRSLPSPRRGRPASRTPSPRPACVRCSHLPWAPLLSSADAA